MFFAERSGPAELVAGLQAWTDSDLEAAIAAAAAATSAATKHEDAKVVRGARRPAHLSPPRGVNSPALEESVPWTTTSRHRHDT